MDVVMQESRRYGKSLRKLSFKDQERVRNQVTKVLHALSSGDSATPFLHVTRATKLAYGLDGSLWIMRVSRDLRVLVTIDNDPLFDQTLVTLLDTAHVDKLDRTLQSVSESLYQGLLQQEVDGD